MPLCGTSKDENGVPLGQGGLQGGRTQEQTHPGAVRHPSQEGIVRRVADHDVPTDVSLPSQSPNHFASFSYTAFAF